MLRKRTVRSKRVYLNVDQELRNSRPRASSDFPHLSRAPGKAAAQDENRIRPNFFVQIVANERQAGLCRAPLGVFFDFRPV